MKLPFILEQTNQAPFEEHENERFREDEHTDMWFVTTVK
jgi:hypothetical protein